MERTIERSDMDVEQRTRRAAATGEDPLMSLPKAELHLHIEGTLEPDLAFALARRNGVTLPYASVEELRAAYRFASLQEFLDLYYACMSALRTRRDFADLVLAYLRHAHAQGLRHVDMFFDPEGHTERGVPLEEVVEGLRDGLREGEAELGVTGTLVMCVLRHLPEETSLRTLDAMLDRYGDLIGTEWTGIGLDSSERGNPPAKHARVFARARAAGLRLVAHAGEEGTPDDVTQALDVLHVEHVDHGVAAAGSAAVMRRLADEHITLTVCPLSNLALQVTPDLARHPLPTLIAHGVPVTINSDDPAYFGGYLGDDFIAARDRIGLTEAQLVACARESVDASFATPARQAAIRQEIDDWVAAHEA